MLQRRSNVVASRGTRRQEVVQLWHSGLIKCLQPRLRIHCIRVREIEAQQLVHHCRVDNGFNPEARVRHIRRPVISTVQVQPISACQAMERFRAATKQEGEQRRDIGSNSVQQQRRTLEVHAVARLTAKSENSLECWNPGSAPRW